MIEMSDSTTFTLQQTLHKVNSVQEMLNSIHIEDLSINLPDGGTPKCAKNSWDFNQKYQNELDDEHVTYHCCYRDVNNPLENIGRPFRLQAKAAKIFDRYMKSKVVMSEEIMEDKHLIPQPVTAFSDNHYEEHLQQIESALRVFGADAAKGYKAIPIIIYDLGMSEEIINYVKRNESFIYRKLNWEEFPEHVGTLYTYAWKSCIWTEVLSEFGSIMWFDTSIDFIVQDREQIKKVAIKHAYNKHASFLYYVHSAGHSVSWATNADMFTYLPSNIHMMNEAANVTMGQANGVMIWNTIEMKNSIMKWGLLCALTKYCIAPKTVWRKDDKVAKWCPKGSETKTYSYICHRYDQSLFAILTRNFYQYNEDRYQVNDEDILGIPERLG